MTYQEVLDTIQVIQTGASNPTKIASLASLVLGKIARRKIRTRLATITTGGNSSIELGIATSLPDFISLKSSGGDFNKCVYYLDASSTPVYMPIKPYSYLKSNPNAGFCAIEGNTLYLSTDDTGVVPATIYFPYYTSYLVYDNSTHAEKYSPSAGTDTFLFKNIFDDIFIDGILLYLTRREKQDKEYYKAREQWEKALNDLIFYN